MDLQSRFRPDADGTLRVFAKKDRLNKNEKNKK